MGKLKTFEILVENTPATGHFKPGDTVSGQVILQLTQDVEVAEVRVSFTGLAHIEWAEVQKSSPMPEHDHGSLDPVSAEEVYVSEVRKLFPPGTQGSNHRKHKTGKNVLTTGLHSYQFQFSVPQNAPSSFCGSQGNVKYTLKAVVERPWKVSCNTRVIDVVSELDLNDVPAARDSVRVSDHIQTGTLLFSPGDCCATMRLEKKGFVPGEIIPVQYSVHNDGPHDVPKVSLHFNMFVTYKANRKTCVQQFPMARRDLGKVPAGKTLEGTDRNIRVPDTCKPTGLPGCSIINIKYQLQLKIKPALLSSKRLRLNTEVVVGTKPLLPAQRLEDNPPDYWSCCPPPYDEVIARYSPRPGGNTVESSPNNSSSSPVVPKTCSSRQLRTRGSSKLRLQIDTSCSRQTNDVSSERDTQFSPMLTSPNPPSLSDTSVTSETFARTSVTAQSDISTSVTPPRVSLFQTDRSPSITSHAVLVSSATDTVSLMSPDPDTSSCMSFVQSLPSAAPGRGSISVPQPPDSDASSSCMSFTQSVPAQHSAPKTSAAASSASSPTACTTNSSPWKNSLQSLKASEDSLAGLQSPRVSVTSLRRPSPSAIEEDIGVVKRLKTAR